MEDERLEELAQEIATLKCQLRATDYEIIKAYEYEMCGMKAPYDINNIHKERQAQRDRINEIKQLLSEEG